MQAKGYAGKAIVCAIAIGLLPACGTRHVSRGISADGVPEQVVFPAMDRAVLKEGTFPNLDDLRQVGPGVSKEQLYHLLGRPHFREGYAGVREWDYIFRFRHDGGVATCQYKVVFDRDYLGRSFYWQPQDCAERLAAAVAAAPPAPAAVAPRRFALSADALFAFGGGGIGDLQPAGREQIARIADELSAAGATGEIRVIGHTDVIGDESANRALSLQRAQTVRQMLIERGVPADRVQAEGRGESEPIARHCDVSLARANLIACLQPDRRVEIAADAIR